MRLFTAIDLPPEVSATFEELLSHLAPLAEIRWSEVGNLHITTKFIGELPEDRVEELKAVLGTIVSREEIPITIKGLGWFPNPHNPRILWAPVQPSLALAELARNLEAVVEPMGIAREERQFKPHLTLARAKPPYNLGDVRHAIADLPSTDWGTFQAPAFHLYSSETDGDVSKYEKLATFPLKT